MRRILALSALALGLLAPAASAAPAQPLGQEGRWVTDAQGRVVLLHGVNMVYKRPPYHPAAAGFDATDARFIAEQGFNTVRVGLIYAGVEPQPGVYDDGYLERIAEVVRLLNAEGIFAQLDFHQDLYNERFQGEGWPDWAVQDDGLPAQPQLGFPANYVGMPALNRAFDHFWANDPGPGGIGLQDRYAAAWRHVAQRLRDEPGLMGYDLLNEPWPGTVWPSCANPEGCPAFDATLTAFSQRVARRIREVDPRGIVWYEPHVLFNNGADTSHGPVPGPAGMSFHIYCLIDRPTSEPVDPAQTAACGPFEQLPLDNADRQAAEHGDALLLSEFGATDDLGQIERVVDAADRALVSWQYWHYCECRDPTTTGAGGTQSLVRDITQPPEGDNVKADKLAILARPYAQAVAGTPTRMRFDRAERRFELAYSTRGPAGTAFDGGVTEISVPRIHYPRGYAVDVDGARVISPARARLLRLRAERGAREVHVTVVPGSGSFPRVDPAGLTAEVTPGRDARRPYRFATTGRLGLPEGVEAADGCAGTVSVQVKRGRRTISTRRARVGEDCTFVSSVAFARPLHGPLRVIVRFAGNDVLRPARLPVRRVRAG